MGGSMYSIKVQVYLKLLTESLVELIVITRCPHLLIKCIGFTNSALSFSTGDLSLCNVECCKNVKFPKLTSEHLPVPALGLQKMRSYHSFDMWQETFYILIVTKISPESVSSLKILKVYHILPWWDLKVQYSKVSVSLSVLSPPQQRSK